MLNLMKLHHSHAQIRNIWFGMKMAWDVNHGLCLLYKIPLYNMYYFLRNGTSMISLIIPPKDQVSRVAKMLADEFGTASNIKSRVNRLSVLSAITSVQQRLKLYSKGENLTFFISLRGCPSFVLIDKGFSLKPVISFSSKYISEALRPFLMSFPFVSSNQWTCCLLWYHCHWWRQGKESQYWLWTL